MQTMLPLTMLLLTAGAGLCYGGTRALWTAAGGHRAPRPFDRGILLAVPVAVLALWLTLTGHGPGGVALLLSGSVITLTLGLGVTAVSYRTEEGVSAGSLRFLAPLCLATCLAGFSGGLRLGHGVLLGLLGLVLWWTQRADAPPDRDRGAIRPAWLLAWAALMLAGLLAIAVGMSGLRHLSNWPLSMPVIVLLVILSSVGLLSSEAHLSPRTDPIDTCSGFVVGALGLALPAIILFAHLAPGEWKDPFATLASAQSTLPAAPATQPETQPNTQPDTQPATAPAAQRPIVSKAPAIVMPLLAWRVDSVLAAVLAMMLLPVAFARFTLGRTEGLLLLALSVLYLVVSTFASARY